jgi:uncharacterized protein YecE (DUF72 family)
MRVRVGTSGFSYKEWKGTFYPEDLPDAKMLRFYGERFDTVEINNTFYRRPQESVLRGWASDVPATFSFVLKAQMGMCHWKNTEVMAASAAYFFETAKALGKRLGPILVQTPPHQKKDLEKLGRFLELVPKGVRITLELTETWHDDEVYAFLKERDVALCAVDDGKKKGKGAPLVCTARWGYLRLRRARYPKKDLEAWAERVVAQPWSDAWIFFKHEDAGTGPRFAAALVRALAARGAAVSTFRGN